jgi:hypothetical protein
VKTQSRTFLLFALTLCCAAAGALTIARAQKLNGDTRAVRWDAVAATHNLGLPQRLELNGPPAQARGRFSHSTPQHKNGKFADCSVCHDLPTRNWRSPRADKQASFPDVINYPNPHTKTNAASVCYQCHADDAYKNGGAFCGSCHTVPSMRAKALLPFPTRSHGKQFTTMFPHDRHQDLIADNASGSPRPAHFVQASFVFIDDKPKPAFYSCAVCHKPAATMPKYGDRVVRGFRSLAAAEPDTFQNPIAPTFFKTSPEGHQACFTCHYQFANLPSRQGCASCHALTERYFEKNATLRYSLKFDHDDPGHVVKDCTSCHVRITQNSDIRTMKDADVPISSCKACHAKPSGTASFETVLNSELDARAARSKENKPAFQCIYCHTTEVGRYEIPVSHKIE